MKNIESKSPIKRILNALSIIWYVLLMCFLLTLCFFIINSKINNKVPVIGNYAILKVMTESMEPTISKHQIVLVKKIPVEKIQVSDVISYYHLVGEKEIIITHRVIQIIQDPQTKDLIGFKTKGDANASEDSWDVQKDKVIGIVDFGHPVVVNVLSFISDPIGIIVLVIFPLSLILISDFVSLFKVVKQKDEDFDNDELLDDISLDDNEFESFDFGVNDYYKEDQYLDDDDDLLDYYSDDD